MTAQPVPAGQVIPPGYLFDGMGKCSSPVCGAPIAWTLTKAARRAPLNADGVSHWATCPDPDRFRKPKGTVPA